VGSFNYDQRFNRSICSEWTRLSGITGHKPLSHSRSTFFDLKKLALSRTMPERASALQMMSAKSDSASKIEAISHEKWLAMSNEYWVTQKYASWELALQLAHLGGEKA